MAELEIPGLGGIEGPWWLIGGLALAAIARFGRPIAKTGIKGYLATRDGINGMASGARRQVQGLYNEALAEYQVSNPPIEMGAETTEAAPSPA
jgi:hypothetical protein